MELYQDKLERDILDIQNDIPGSKELIDSLKKIMRASEMEFDNMLEREWHMYIRVVEFVNKLSSK